MPLPRLAPMRRALVGAAAVLVACQAQAWSAHTWCTWQALSVLPELAATQVQAEPLERFIAAEAPRLEALLAEHEAWARINLASYPPRPDALAFRAAPGGDTRPLAERFQQALRLNGQSRLKLFVQMRPGSVPPGKPRMPWVDISALRSGAAARENTYVQLSEGESVSALEVVATASAEPDYGLDIGLFADNGTEQGKRFGYGTQPFGSPAVDYSSQAPFHMGFFHEAAIVNAAAGFLKRTHPESRIALFSALARHAFATGHDYWGWRFTGWAMHYVQDLTQPYHARVLPGVSTARMLWINALDIAGFKGAKNDAITRVTNRHIVLENYQLRRISAAIERRDDTDPLLAALRDTALDTAQPPFNASSARLLVSAEAAASADELDAQLERTFPARYVSDPAQPLGNEASAIDMLAVAQQAAPAERAALEGQLSTLLTRLGRHTRALLRAVRSPG